jgi:hypothetical protein
MYHLTQITGLLICTFLFLIIYKMNQQALDNTYIKAKLPPLPLVKSSVPRLVRKAMSVYVQAYLFINRIQRPVINSSVSIRRPQAKRGFARRVL